MKRIIFTGTYSIEDFNQISRYILKNSSTIFVAVINDYTDVYFKFIFDNSTFCLSWDVFEEIQVIQLEQNSVITIENLADFLAQEYVVQVGCVN